jgi:tetratricopeptide (TPR) repeat protein
LSEFTLCLAISIVVSAPAFFAASLDYAKIESAIQQRDFIWAQQELEQHLREEPGDSRAHILLGIVLEERNEPQLAMDHFQEAVRLRPNAPEPHLNLGNHYARAGDLEAAVREFQFALRLNPGDPAACNNLGLALMGQKKYSEAAKEFKKAVELNPKEPAGWLNLFKGQLALKEFAAARRTADRIAQFSPGSGEVYTRLGVEQAGAGDFAGAVANLQRARKLQPRSTTAQYNLGLAYYRSGNLDHAVEMLGSLRKNEDTAEVENLLGEVYEKKAEYLNAVRALQKAAEMEPRNEDYRFDYILELLAHHNFDAAVLVAEPAVQDFSNSMRMRLVLGVAYFGRGRFTESTQSFSETAKRFPELELPLYFLALAADSTGKDLEETRELLEEYRERHPEQFWPYYFLGRYALHPDVSSEQKADPDRAERLLKESLKRKADFADAHYELGNVYSTQKRWSQAIEEYQKATHLNPKLSEAHYRLARAYRHTGDLPGSLREVDVHRKLKQEEAQEALRLRQVRAFLYKLRQ